MGLSGTCSGTDGLPKLDERDGGGTDGYVSPCTTNAAAAAAAAAPAPAELGGLVMFVETLTKLAGVAPDALEE